jgi:ubiquinone/menaquinone biosynthesis C-methylase UbiE
MKSATRQGRLWGAAAQDWAKLQEPLARRLWEAMLDAAAVGPGTRVLDAGCGAGGASVLAAGRGAHVNGLDAAEALLAIARRRLPDGDFRTGGLEALPYPDGTFDAILVADVLPYVADPLATLRELRRVCAWQGRLVVATWGRPEECDQWAIEAAVRGGACADRWRDVRPFRSRRTGRAAGVGGPGGDRRRHRGVPV